MMRPMIAAAKRSPVVSVRRMHRRDINRAWEFLKLVFRGVNQKTVEYQRPRSKVRFVEVYDDEGVDQLLFEVGSDIVGYAECSYSTSGADNWMNPRYFDKRGMRPLFVDELAVHPLYQGKGVGGFMLEQLQHSARARGCTHLVLEVAQNNKPALTWYHKRNFFRLDAAIFMAQKVPVEPELLPARPLKHKHGEPGALRTGSTGKGAPTARTMIAAEVLRVEGTPNIEAHVSRLDEGDAPKKKRPSAKSTESSPASAGSKSPAAKKSPSKKPASPPKMSVPNVQKPPAKKPLAKKPTPKKASKKRA